MNWRWVGVRVDFPSREVEFWISSRVESTLSITIAKIAAAGVGEALYSQLSINRLSQ